MSSANENEEAGVFYRPEKRTKNTSDEVAISSQENVDVDSRKVEPKQINILQLFSFATRSDWLLVFIGTVIAILNGAILPGAMLVFGEVLNLYVYRNLTTEIYANVTGVAANTGTENCTIIRSFITLIDAQSTAFGPDTFRCLTIDDFLSEINILIFIFVGLALCTLLFGFIQVWTFSLAAQRQAYRMRLSFFRAVLRQEISWFDDNKSGELSARLNENLVKVQEGIGDKLSVGFQFLSTFLSSFIIGFAIEWRMTLLMLGLTPILAIAAFLFAKLIEAYTSREQKRYAGAGAVAEEVLSSIRTVVAFGGEEKEHQRYCDRLADAKKTGAQKGFIAGASLAVNFITILGTYALALWFSAFLISNGLALPGDTITVFFSVFIGAFYIGQAGPSFQGLGIATASLTFAYRVIKREPLIDSSSDEGEKPSSMSGNIKFKKVYFSYPSQLDSYTLEDLTLEAGVGKTLALVGSSGSGKSTILQLLLRFYDVEEGEVLIDGINIKTLNLKWLRNNIGVVGQEPVLFATTIFENIRYGREGVTQEEIEEAARAANAHDFIVSLPKGYDTLVGERGAQMSGGQKQRIAIARALVRNPKILLLDEATSALDAESEKIVQDALDKACKDRTTIIVAHRLSTIQNADMIAVLSDGFVVELGSHDNLMSINGMYHSLVNSQTSIQNIKKRGRTRSSVGRRASFSETSRRSRSFYGKLSNRLSRMGSFHSHAFESEDSEMENLNLEAAPSHDQIGVKVEREEEEEEEDAKVSLLKIYAKNCTEWPLFVFGVIGSLVEGATFPVFAILFGEILRVFLEEDPLVNVGFWCGMLAILGVVTGLGAFVKSFSFTLTGEFLTSRLRKQLFKAILNQEMAWFDDERNSTGTLSIRLSNDAAQVQGASGIRLGILLQVGFSLLLALVVSLAYSWSLALIILGVLPILVLTGIINAQAVAGLSKRSRLSLEAAANIASESFTGIQSVQSLGLEDVMFKHYQRELLKSHQKSAVVNPLVAAVSYALPNFVLLLGYAVVFRYGAFLVTRPKGDLVFTTFYDIVRVFNALFLGTIFAGQATALAPDYAKARLSANRVFSLLQREPAITVLEDKGSVPTEVKGQLKLSSVFFSYPSRPETKILKNMNLPIKEGKTLALVGTSGSGKSTIISLIERFYDPDSTGGGAVQLDGQDLRTLNLKWLRSQIGLVSQEPVLFDASIADNIRYGANFREVLDEEVEEAAKAANIHKFVISLAQGYKTNVGARGTQMSGGQKQRIAIARALVRNPKILLLDEATSALDAESEVIVQKALDEVRQGRTTLVIAHRLSTIQNADCIAVLKNGQVVESGSHAELLRKEGLYHNLIKIQLQKKDTN